MRAFKSLAVSVSITLFSAGFAVAGTRLRVTGDDVSLRPRGDLHSEVLGSVSRGQTLEAVDWPGDGEWVSVRPPAGQELWVYAELVTDGVVNSSRVKVRGGPSVNYKDVATLSKGDTVKVLGRTGEWLRIETPPDAVLWISRQYVAPADGSAAPAPVVAGPAVPGPVEPAPEPVAAVPPPPPLPEPVTPPVPEPQRRVVVAAEPVAVPVPVPAERPAVAAVPAEPALATLAHESQPAVITQMRHDPPAKTASAQPTPVHPTPVQPTPVQPTSVVRENPPARVATSAQGSSTSVAPTQPRQEPTAVPAAATSAGASASVPVATATTRVRTVSPRAYPRRQVPQTRQVEIVPAPGSQRVSYTGEVTAGGKLTLTNRGEYRLVTRDAQGRALTLCFLSGSADQLESLRGESVKVEGFQTWNTGARHPTVAVDSIIRVAPQN